MKMTSLIRISKAAIASLALFAIAGTANAVIILTPTASAAGVGYGPTNCEPGCVESFFGTTGLSLLYKDNVGGSEEGSFAGSYETAFLNTPSDPADALITYVGGPSITCPSCYLAIKDGNNTPGYYFYDLSAWDGTETIGLYDFWAERGAISHISIWGTSTATNVPEPATLGLFGIGLLGMGIARRRKIV